MTLSTRRVSRCRILNERTWPIGIGWATRPMKRGWIPTSLPSTVSVTAYMEPIRVRLNGATPCSG